ncbi:TolB family protein [candidate division KSB1 bacterium]
MTNKIVGFGMLFFIFLFIDNCTKKEEGFPVLKGPYFGQKPPGLTPEIFAPCIISTDGDETLPVFSPEGDELFYSLKYGTEKRLTILTSKQKNGVWTEPEIASFSGQYYDAASSISPDGQSLYFVSMRPLRSGDSPFEVQNIWVIEKYGNTWRDPVMLPPPVNSDARELGGTLTKGGYFYFSTTRKEIKGGKCRLKFVDGKYSEPESIHEIYNFEIPFFEMARHPDEKFVVFVSYGQEDGFGEFDLYLSFNMGKDIWTKPVNLGEKINTKANEHFPIFSHDGRYLFFVSDRISEEYKAKENRPGNGSSDIYWVSAEILDNLKPGGF